MRFVDDSKKQLNWWNRNYFFIGTIIYVVLNLMFYMFFIRSNYNLSFYNNFWQTLLTYSQDVHIHNSWSHVLHNMLGYSVCAFYIERKMGSLNFILLNIYITIICAFMQSGCSVVWFFMLGYVFIDFLFSFHKHKRNITNIIVGAIVLALEYFRCCFYDMPDGGIGLKALPTQLIDNSAHLKGFIIGFITCLIVQIAQLSIINRYTPKEINNNNKPLAYKFVYPLVAFLIVGMSITPVYFSNRVKDRTDFTFNIICSEPEKSETFKFDSSKEIITNYLLDWQSAHFNHNHTTVLYYYDAEYTKPITSISFWHPANRRGKFIPLSYETELTLYAQVL